MAKKTKKLLSFAELTADNDMEFLDVETKRGVVRLGTISSFDILLWLEENADPARSKFAGLRLLVKSIIADPETGARIGDEFDDAASKAAAQMAALEMLKKRDAKENGVLVRHALQLNGLKAASKEAEIVKVLKNVSSETATGDSPSESLSQPDDSTETTS